MHIDRDLLVEVDRQMLRHGIQAMHGKRLELPTRRKDLAGPRTARRALRDLRSHRLKPRG